MDEQQISADVEQSQSAPPLNATTSADEKAPQGVSGRTNSPPRSALGALARLDTNQWLTLAVAVASAGIAYASYRNSADTSDIKHAVTGLADLARQTKRQADTQGGELVLLKAQRPILDRQANAAADSARAAKDTAETAKQQTGAIIKQADALIQSASATTKAAAAQLTAAQANTKTAEAGAAAAEAQRQSAVLFSNTRAPVAKFSSVQIQGWLDQPKDGLVKVSVKPSITNAGGGALLPTKVIFSLLVTDQLPDKPPAGLSRVFGGNDIVVAPNGDFGPIKPFDYRLSKIDIDAVLAQKKGMVVWGNIQYADSAGKTYQTCYVDVVLTPTQEDSGGAVRPMFAPSYCGN